MSVYVIEPQTNQKHKADVLIVDSNDYKIITAKQFFFQWKKERAPAITYKLVILNEQLLGVISLIRYDSEYRIEIKLLAVSTDNKGKSKKYDRVAGCLIAFAASEALTLYGELGCVSLIPKTELKQHYIRQYGMIDAGWQLYLEGRQLLQLLKAYL
ncbi:N-acetyltransferase [Flavipsychrobacter stenotrophus]|uniref:N-acetyltransferase n=1 Tax=Flavipsychrobacter stenotrophus TaxID=2077091 RepID=A0A2S7SYV5_9BACT|nr:N-acetyltransferase [Flavipsychrobacter stenotrophus]PQJ11706.1 N-acetyltransferase [Flavipsychrobacter stenotrophus]